MTWDRVVKAIAGFAGAIAGIFGGWDTMLQVLMICIVVDYLSGWVVAIMGRSAKTETGHLDSKVGFVGILKKCLILAMVLLATYLDRAIGQEAVFRNMVIWFYIANEGLSILENLALAGVPFPKAVRSALEQIKAKNDEPPDGSAEDNNFPPAP